MKKVFVVMFLVFISVFGIMYFGVLDDFVPVHPGDQVPSDGNLLHDDSRKEAEKIPSSSQGKDKKEDEEDDNKDYIKAKVISVIDGDTILVETEDRKDAFKVRYIGIDTPESVHTDESKNTEEGKIASERNKKLIKDAGNTVYLEYDVQETDKYGRDLCYVYVKNGKKYEMLQEKLLSEGLCRVMTIQPNSKYADKFYDLQKDARKSDAGFWGTDFFS